MTKRALVLISDGCEDIETIAPIDILNRAGVDVTVASLKPGPVKGAYGNTFHPDLTLDQVTGVFDAIVLPGGSKNAKDLASDPRVVRLLKEQHGNGRLVAAICASPGNVLAEAAGLLKGKPATGDPGFNDKLAAGGAKVTDADVTISDNIITARGPGAAIKFGLAIAEYLTGDRVTSALAAKWRVSS